MSLRWLITGSLILTAGQSAAQEPPLSVRLAAAVVALPGSLRSGAGVVVFDRQGHPRTLRYSTNGMICIGDPPGDVFFEVECYQEQFMPVVYRIRELVAAGVPRAAVGRRIEAEIREGRLKLSPRPTMNYQVFGPIGAYDSVTNTLSGGARLVERLFMPWSTAASAGLPNDEGPLYPWIMDEGTYHAHLMIFPVSAAPPHPPEP